MRIGLGYDAHPLLPGRDLIIGGVKISFDKGLEGHSDADVLVHAIMDALLGAAGLRDIGHHFPSGDERFKGVSSLHLLEQVGHLITARGYTIKNIDSVLIAQEPKIAPYLDLIIDNIRLALRIEREQVMVKATTTDGLGFTGRGEGMAACATALIEE